MILEKQRGVKQNPFTLVELLIVLGISGVTFLMLVLSIPEPRGPGPGPHRISCQTNVRQLGLGLAMYAHGHQGAMPTGNTSGAVLKVLYKEGYLDNLQLLSCPANPVEDIDFDSPHGISYYIDPDLPASDRHPLRAVLADRNSPEGWETNHGDGVHILFEDGSAQFVRGEDRRPEDTIGNPHLAEHPKDDTDIYSSVSDPYESEWDAHIRWER